ncbi:beta-N-acetylhexosaminidase [Streptomyces abyssalis]|uniref:beta-N-acetylhexosaminidase n=1 Tax=Streptomyces abyssalis TaxID=933944 RepID=A0A1E7JJI7_9ACTN|nr:beta-N-acetylhexosaminidase [Streptomyces abyssalis]OEU87271.1 beta-N-acetylhexosaminidase [Streptomyces abyssalis]OEU87803.1 beta-N-acetylhexosaminidase [Streptomyces abyssalis]
MRRIRPLLLCAALLVTVLPGSTAAAAAENPGPRERQPTPLGHVVPAPESVREGGGAFTITDRTVIRVTGSSGEARRVADQLAGLLRPSTGYRLPVTTQPGRDGIQLRLTGGKSPGKSGKSGLGAEGYRLKVSPKAAVISAPTGTGLFHGMQTLRQLLPPQIESRTEQPGPWQVAGGTVTDRPRYAYRGAMLDVSRHFFSVEEVKRYIDQLAMYKINKLHLHLSDDQGWRIAIDSWPRLATYGGGTEVGGGPGGHYTKADYREIIRYADEHELTVVPEIDMPGHTNAALASYAELNCDGVAPPRYTGIEVGFSSLCVPLDVTYDFVDDVVRELAEMTPGRYLHIGGDEAHSTSHEDYVAFMERAQKTVAKYGKTVIGWHQLTGAKPAEGAVAQYWGTSGAADEPEVVEAAKKGTKLILSPANRAYLDMQYNEDTPLGLHWAGYVEAEQSYSWEPGSYIEGAPEGAVLGVEAPLWSETLENSEHIEFMAFPRLPGIAELGWSPESALGWEGYRERLAEQGPRWEQLGMEYWRSPQVPWPGGSR